MTKEQEQLLIDQFSIREYQYEITHPRCPVCGGYMTQQSETYDYHNYYQWYECDCCGYCQD